MKLIVQEPGSEKIKQLYEHRPIFTSWILVGETIGVLKLKRFGRQVHPLDDHAYGRALNRLFTDLDAGDIRVVDLNLIDGQPALGMLSDTAILEMRRNHPELDYADSMQFVAIRTNILRVLAGQSRPSLVTADTKLYRAAKAAAIPAIWVGQDSPIPSPGV